MSLIVFAVICWLPQSAISQDSWHALMQRAHSAARQQNYDSAVCLAAQALTLAERQYGTEDTTVARICFSLGEYLNEQGSYLEAEANWLRSLDIREHLLGADHPDVARSLIRAGTALERTGNFQDALGHFNRALEILSKRFGTRSLRAAEVLQQLCILHWNTNNLVEAERLGSDYLACLQDSLGPTNDKTLRALNVLGLIYWRQANYSRAEQIFRRAVTAAEGVGDRRPRILSSILNNLALVYEDAGRPAEAEATARQALETAEEIYGGAHPKLSAPLITLADVLVKRGKYGEAEPLYWRQIAIKEEAHGKGHESISYALRGLAALYERLGQYRAAESLYLVAVNMYESFFDADHPTVAETLEEYSHTLFLSDQFDSSLAVARRAFEIRQSSFHGNAWVMTEEEALTYSRLVRKAADNFLSLLWSRPDRVSTRPESAADVILAVKGAVSDGMFQQRRQLASETDTVVQTVAAQCRRVRTELAHQYVRGPRGSPERHRARIDSLRLAADSLEHLLARLSPSFRHIYGERKVSLSRIRSLLPRGCALVEYMKYSFQQPGIDRRQQRYMALVIDPAGAVILLNLGSAALIDSSVSAYRNHLRDLAEQWPYITDLQLQTELRLAASLYSQVWQPVADHARPADMLLISPDGSLNLLSFAGLRQPDGSYLIERYPIHYLSAARDMIRLKNRYDPGSGLLAIGDPDYNAAADARKAAIDVRDQPLGPPIIVRQDSGVDNSRKRVNGRLGLGPIPYSRREVKSVSSVWERVYSEAAGTCVGVAASEENFRRLAPGKRCLHLATHGFFDIETSGDSTIAGEAGRSRGNPLLRSGLFLAGANFQGSEDAAREADDGFLTAYEVAGMDLTGVQWVVLSACESGLGEIRAGEGVYGLRRAFQLAGARTVISSLWRIPDKRSAAFMERLYGSAHGNLAVIMQEIALWEIRDLRERGLPDLPFTWAAFVATGDWLTGP